MYITMLDMDRIYTILSEHDPEKNKKISSLSTLVKNVFGMSVVFDISDASELTVTPTSSFTSIKTNYDNGTGNIPHISRFHSGRIDYKKGRVMGHLADQLLVVNLPEEKWMKLDVNARQILVITMLYTCFASLVAYNHMMESNYIVDCVRRRYNVTTDDKTPLISNLKRAGVEVDPSIFNKVKSADEAQLVLKAYLDLKLSEQMGYNILTAEGLEKYVKAKVSEYYGDTATDDAFKSYANDNGEMTVFESVTFVFVFYWVYYTLLYGPLIATQIVILAIGLFVFVYVITSAIMSILFGKTATFDIKGYKSRNIPAAQRTLFASGQALIEKVAKSIREDSFIVAVSSKIRSPFGELTIDDVKKLF